MYDVNAISPSFTNLQPDSAEPVADSNVSDPNDLLAQDPGCDGIVSDPAGVLEPAPSVSNDSDPFGLQALADGQARPPVSQRTPAPLDPPRREDTPGDHVRDALFYTGEFFRDLSDKNYGELHLDVLSAVGHIGEAIFDQLFTSDEKPSAP